MSTGCVRACGGCWWGQFAAGKSEGDCHNQPPKVFALPAAKGEFQVVTVRPAVGLYDRACCFFSSRLEPRKPRDPGAVRFFDRGEPRA